MLALAILATLPPIVLPVYGRGEFTLQVVDSATGDPVPVRMVLQRENGTQAPVRRGVNAGVGAAVDGEVELGLAPNTYTFEISRGPEYRVISGSFVIDRDSQDSRTLELTRIANLAEEGWIPGDLMAAVDPRHAGVLMASETLAVAGLVSPTGTAQPDPPELPVGYSARTDLARGLGDAAGLLAVGVDQQLAAQLGQEENATAPSSLFIRQLATAASPPPAAPTAGRPGSPRLVIANPLAWDVPIWLSSGRVDAVVVLGEFLQLDQPRVTLQGSRPPTKFDYQDARGLGRWAEHTYWQMLEAGLHPVPAAASGAGLVRNPIGYNRAYVYDAAGAARGADRMPLASGASAVWWDGLWRGRSVVTNGPLLRPLLDGQAPGHRFEASSGRTLELDLELELAIRDPVEYLDVIRDGRVVHHARLDEFAAAGGRIPPLQFDQSGWVAVRVMTKYPSHYRAAISAPWFVVFDGKPRISAKGVTFFREWLDEREQMLAELPAEQLQQHAPYVRAARRFWQQQAEAANAP